MSQTIQLYGALEACLKERKFAFKPAFDGRLTRFDRNGKILSAWCVGKTLETRTGTIQMLMFGDFATGERYDWWSRKALTKEEAQNLATAAKEERKKYQDAKRQRQKEAAKECEEFWATLPPTGSPTGYCLKKQLFELYGARRDEGESLYVPIHAANGALLNLQRIEADGTKRFWPGGAIAGNLIFLDGYPQSAPETIYLAEGYSTGASILEALRAGASPPLHPAQVPQPDSSGDDSRGPGFTGGSGALQPARGHDLPDARRMAQIPASDTPQDGGILKAPRENGQGDCDPFAQTGQGSQGGQNPRDDRRQRLEHELLAALAPTHAQRSSNDRAGQGRDQGLLQSAGETNGACTADPSGSTRLAATPGSDGGRGDKRPSQDPGNHSDRLRGKDWPADGGIGSKEAYGCGPDKGRPAALPEGSRPNLPLVACALNAGNVLHAARALKKRWPAARLILCADDDRYTTHPDGRAYNPGLEACVEAATVLEGSVVVPVFSLGELTHRPTDFNDLSLLPDGRARTVACLAMELTPNHAQKILTDRTKEAPQADTANEPRALLPAPTDELLVAFDKRGNPQFPPPQKVADHVLRLYEGLLVKQGMDLFKYRGTHWHHLDRTGLDDLSLVIQDMCADQCSPSQLDTYIEMIRRTAPSVPPGKNIFASDPWCANFLNGTLHIIRNCTRYYTEFRPHAASDYLINCLPYQYAPTAELPVNDDLEAMLDRLFEGESDGAEKRRAVAQMFGACLAPMSPRLFMLHGAPGSGKSTVIKLAARLVHRDNSCSVDPTEFHGFGMETMMGKLVNYVTDIDTSKPIKDAAIKRIEDRLEVTVQRKYEKNIMAPLPAVHIFGGNDIPPTLEGASRAHNRRWTFLEFTRVLTNGKFDKAFAERVFEANPLGVLRFALLGLEDLLASDGIFVQPASGKAAMEEWQNLSDAVGGFIDAVKNGEVLDGNTTVSVDSNSQTIRAKLYEIFKEHRGQVAPDHRCLGAGEFYKRLAQHGFKLKKVHGARFIEGIKVGAGINSEC